ncbi:hypothetical protein HZR84_01465 [Hyphobacterium sp. CCMP332]|nr:hypothetical protein HZR84_01465 [Hyphobacterium sp. CCMP332]
MYWPVLVFFSLFILITIDAYFRAERISIGLAKRFKIVLRLVILIAFNLILFSIMALNRTYDIIIAFNVFLFLSWMIFYNGMSNVFEGHHWFYPHLNNEIERKIYKGSGVRAIVKQSFFHLLKWTLLIASFLYLFK